MKWRSLDRIDRSTAAATATVLCSTVALCLAAALSTTACARPTTAEPPWVRGSHVVIPVNGGRADVDTTTLAAVTEGVGIDLSAPAQSELGPVGAIRVDGDVATWNYPDQALTASAAAEHGRLRVTLRSDRDGRLVWPVTGADPAAVSLQLPRGEGLSLPVADPFWNSPNATLIDSALDMTSGLTMPFWGYRIGDRGVGYIVPTDIGTALTVTSTEGRLQTRATHEFDARAATREYTVTFALTDADPIAAAKDYRNWLMEHDQFRSLADKIQQNPSIARLLGAFHAYVFGDGKSPEAMRQLHDLGVSRMWIGYDSDDNPMSAAAIDAAEKAGYIAGPYDSYANAQDPATADNPSSRWPDQVWPDGCVLTADGTPQTGFGDRGCYLSSQALAQDPTLLDDRYAAMTGNGADTYFLDVDAAGEFFDDYSPNHPMNQRRDRENRLARMRLLAQDRQQVLGSEAAGAWAAPDLAFNHGAQTPVTDLLWPLERNREVWGGYAPAGAPKVFFKPVDLPAGVAEAMFDPAYRIPLYETVLHDSIVNVDRWELSYYKLPQQRTMRALTAMLNNTPLNFVLDRATLADHGTEIARLQQFFAPLHESAATLPMTSFQWLADDHSVQRSVFGDNALTVTANFGSQTYGELPAGCVDATLAGDTTPRRLCPGQ
ncbi:glycoside hydrolase [Nocardia sp. NBC_01009]|uniref:glycoside hydrolase n=1 Tax=Nocardia sp. NBC_01009 TaxID=2975996 RepID=UPI003867C2BC|nr:glycoside hydrolase [Nocardia sp. NBC_01009]